MDPIKVDFASDNNGGGKKKNVVIMPRKTGVITLLSILIALIGGGIIYYFMLPALNFKDGGIYKFIIILLAVYLGSQAVLSGSIKRPEYVGYVKKQAVVPVILGGIVLIFGVVGIIISSVFFRASSYSKIISVDEEKTFVSDIKEVDFSAVPVLDNLACGELAKKTLGDLSSINKVSQFEVAGDFTQINYKEKPVRVTTLQYGDIFKWLKNTKDGIPGYIVVDMVTQKAELSILKEGSYIRYSTYEHFSKYLMRHVRFAYPTYLFDTPTFEIDENGNPYWICPVLDKTIGIFGGTDVIGAVLVNAVTGEFNEYSVADIKDNTSLQWIDGIYSSSLLVEQYNYYGKYQKGFWNSIITQTGVKSATEGSNYLAINDDVYMYTGVTSAGSDEAIIGFVLINMRTKEANFYKVSGAKEYSAASSAEGEVQNYKYAATFPILLNINGQATYFMSLKDDSNIVKMYAMVNVEQYQVVATGTTISECTENYMKKLKNNGIFINVDIDSINDVQADDIDKEEEITVKGKIADILTAVISGDSYYYIKLENGDSYYSVKAGDNERVVILKVGDKAELVLESESGEIIPARLK